MSGTVLMAAKPFKAELHPRGPNGRFTKSWAKTMTAADKRKAGRVLAGFHPEDLDVKAFGSPMGGRSADESSALDRYAAGDWKTVNAQLREGDTSHPDVAHIDSAMHPLPHDTDLHRVVPVSVLGNVDPQSLAGRKVKDAAYASTSVSEPGAAQVPVVRMHISAPVGTKAVALGEGGEILLARDTEMAIERVEPDGHGNYDMHLIVLSKGRARASRSTAAPKAPAAKEPEAPTPSGTSSLADRVASGVVERHVLSGGIVGKTERVVLADGSRAVHKQVKQFGTFTAKHQADAEELGAAMVRAFDVRTPEVYRPAGGKAWRDEVYMELLDGQIAGAITDQRLLQELSDSRDGRALGLADLLMANGDRNSGNWLVDDANKIGAIDHGIAFEWTGVDPTKPTEPTNPFWDNYITYDRGVFTWAQISPLTEGDVPIIRQRLESVRPEFERLGHLDWYDNAVARFEVLATYARKNALSEGLFTEAVT